MIGVNAYRRRAFLVYRKLAAWKLNFANHFREIFVLSYSIMHDAQYLFIVPILYKTHSNGILKLNIYVKDIHTTQN